MLRKQFDRFVKQNALKLPVGSADFAEQCVEACYVEALGSVKTVRSREALEQVLQSAKSQVVGIGDRLVALLERIIVIRLTLKKRLSALSSAPGYLTSDVASQLERLFGPKFVAESGFGRLKDYPRYLDAIELRLGKAPFMGPKDKVDSELLAGYWQKLDIFKNAPQTNGAESNAAKFEELRWMLEEYRVSAFAQSLKTKMPVSPARIEKAFERLKANSRGQ
jgi:ATP-dependent helicase HrpA